MSFKGVRRIASAIMLLAAWLCLSPPATAQRVATEQSMRAAMLFNFLKFTEFPTESIESPYLRLCFSVADPVQAEALTSLSGRKIFNRELAVARLGERGDNCQVVYLDSRQRWHAATERGLGNALTIGGYPGFAEDGGMIEIDLQPDGNRFDVNLAQARAARLRMSPQLLRLARRIHE